MAEDEDPEIAAALAELAGQDAAVADDARAALEWIAGEQGLAFITQERIQNFCWYQLPVKWLIDLDGVVRSPNHPLALTSSAWAQAARPPTGQRPLKVRPGANLQVSRGAAEALPDPAAC